ncbi:hypothetical protein RRG08_066248 [Elysia crispata]|uniref:Uncharacterized protein n=1 Tax=Elysia crispata TaxID=231223 RepID=A0AAE1BFF0_9GAST|nr:hypothetical protein RRG08_066248 [Elysia crispata]
MTRLCPNSKNQFPATYSTVTLPASRLLVSPPGLEIAVSLFRPHPVRPAVCSFCSATDITRADTRDGPAAPYTHRALTPPELLDNVVSLALAGHGLTPGLILKALY